MNIRHVDQHHAPQAIELLGDLRLSLFGIRSRRLHTALVNDGVKRCIDFRIAVESEKVCGVVLAAPASYWRSAPLKHWGLAVESLRARLAGRRAGTRSPAGSDTTALSTDSGAPPRTWSAPGDAWRIILIGTAAAARGKGIAAELYRAMMADRSLVARIALDNTPSIRLHRSLGWRLYPDGEVALAVHLRVFQRTPSHESAGVGTGR